jgi:hypothetical protein
MNWPLVSLHKHRTSVFGNQKTENEKSTSEDCIEVLPGKTEYPNIFSSLKIE